MGIAVAHTWRMEFLDWLENLGFVTWIRESESLLGYTLYLAGHTIGLVFLVGPNLVIAARVLGLAPDLPLKPMARFKPVMGVGLVLTVITGLVLFATAPVSYVRNIVFIVKIAAIAAALVCLRGVVKRLFAAGRNPDDHPVTSRVKALTGATLVFWTIAVVAGRLTAYSGVVVVASLAAFLAVAVVTACVIAAIALFRRRGASHARSLSLDVTPSPVSGGK
jgi:hypothetical protein